jgi:hypothetical protein
MSRHAQTFVGACLKGEAILADIDDWVDRWHDTDFGSGAPTLDEFLGFTSDEGKLWVEKPPVLGAIVAAHKARTNVAKILQAQAQDSYDLAARSVSYEDACNVLQWLIDRGRIAART